LCYYEELVLSARISGTFFPENLLDRLNQFIRLFFFMANLFGVNRRQSSRVRGLMACGTLAMGSVLAAPLGARALDFDWYFTASTGEVTRGTIKGLVEGYNSGGAGEIVEVVATPLTLALGGDWIFDSSFESPFAFNVVNGEIVAADALYMRMFAGLPQQVGFGRFGPGSATSSWAPQINDGVSASYPVGGTETVFGLPPAPAPLPIFGAAVAFGYGRRLRSRVRAARRQSGLAPTV